ncbi:MAG: hypothetical protein QGG36_04705, partial [Pirellulaceae bacterium]|nr:hypothetical protein [Pirellulaceae bacterium]
MRVRTIVLVAAQGRAGKWTSDDLEAAREQANQLIRRERPTEATRTLASAHALDRDRFQFALANTPAELCSDCPELEEEV